METVKIFVQHGDMLPRLGETLDRKQWFDFTNGPVVQGIMLRSVSVPLSPLALGEAYLRYEKVPPGNWPPEAVDLLDKAWALVRVRERFDEQNTIVDRDAFDALERVLFAIKAETEKTGPVDSD